MAVNNIDEEADEELLKQLKAIDEIQAKHSCCHRLNSAWKSLKLRSALGHIGLMVSLSIYCVVGGIVSMSNKLLLFSIFGSDGFQGDILIRNKHLDRM